jgi:hypothetical protein
MKKTFLVLCISGVIQHSAMAELDFPEFTKLRPAAQQAWGYTVEINEGPKPRLIVTLSPTAAKSYQGARLFLRDTQSGTTTETPPTITRSPDGSISLSVSLDETFQGSADLIVFQGHVPGAPLSPNFGGFTFRLSSHKSK